MSAASQDNIGSHFLINDNIVECFDILDRIQVHITRCLNCGYGELRRHVLVNNKRLQSDHSNVCGLYCVYFLHKRLFGQTMNHVIETFDFDTRENDRFIYNLFSRVYPRCVYNAFVYNQSCKARCDTCYT